MSHRIVGQPVPRLDGWDKVTGHGRYAWDMSVSGTLWARVLRSPVPHARIIRIDTTRAEAMPGVRAVLTGRDIPGRRQGNALRDAPVLAWDRVRFVGERVAAVAADTPEQAEAARDAIEVEYAELPAVFDPLDAMASCAPTLHPDLESYYGVPQRDYGPNVVSVFRQKRGDITAGLSRSWRVFEHTFHTQTQHQLYMEPHNCLVWTDDVGQVHVWSSTKGPFPLRNQLAWTLGVPKEDVVVHVTFCGGDFGGKGTIFDEAVCYYLAKASGRPVRLVTSWVEEFQAGNPRHPAIITIQSGVDREGRLLCRRVKAIFDTGAYGCFKPVPNGNLWGVYYATGPYRIPDINVESIVVYTNSVPRGHMRAPGGPQFAFAVESHTDLIAVELGMDPLEFRLVNATDVGDVGVFGHVHDSGAKGVLATAAETAGWGRFHLESNRGLGIAVGQWETGDGSTGCTLRLEADGTVRFRSAISDPGTGSRSVVRQVLAEELGIPVHSVAVEPLGTDVTLFDQGSGGSRGTFVQGRAALQATERLRARLLPVAEELLEAPAEILDWSKDGFMVRGRPESRASLKQLAAAAVERDGCPIEVNSEYGVDQPEEDTFAVLVADVQVDVETGQVQIQRLTMAQDVGFAVNPQQVEAQIQGGLIQGLGYSLIEELRLEDGRIQNGSLAEYKVPATTDVPPLDIVLIEGGAGPGPYGAKAVGELPVIPVAAAIANAVHAACGVRITDLPITPEKVLARLHAQSVRQ